MTTGETKPVLPAWRRSTEGEQRWPAMLVVLATLALQVALPHELVMQPWWLLPALSGLLVVALLLISPGRMTELSRVERVISLVLVALVSLANALSAGELVLAIATGTIGDHAAQVLVSGGIIYWTNIVVFSLWYWEFDRGGAGMRASGRAEFPDLMFPQMSDPEMSHQDWEPTYLDYLYFSFTNAAAFSPTDVMPLRIWAKMTMMLQAAISLVLALMVVAWAVSSLKPG